MNGDVQHLDVHGIERHIWRRWLERHAIDGWQDIPLDATIERRAEARQVAAEVLLRNEQGRFYLDQTGAVARGVRVWQLEAPPQPWPDIPGPPWTDRGEVTS